MAITEEQAIELIARASKRELLRNNSLFKNLQNNWGIVTCGELDMSGSNTRVTIDVSGWGFESADDYYVFTESMNNDVNSGILVDRTPSSFTVWVTDFITGAPSSRPINYVIIAKGFGGGSGSSGGSGLPSGGAKGDIIVKKSSADGDVEWTPLDTSEWGVAKSDAVNVPIANQTGSFNISIEDLGIASVSDYNIVFSVVGGTGTGAWGDSIVFVHSRTTSMIRGSVNAPQGDIQNVLVSYAIIAKGYGTTVGGSGGTVDSSTTFDVTAIPQGPTDANEVIAVLSNKDNENVRLSYIRQQDGSVPNTVNLGLMSGLGDDSFEITTPAYVAAATEELQKQKVTGYFERTDYPITLDTVGQPYYALARDSFKIEIENHKPYTYEFTASDVFNLTTRYNETVGKTFVTMNEDNETIYITMKGALPDNVQYVVGTTNPIVDLTNATITLTKTTFIQQIDDMLIPKSSGEVFVFDVDSEQFTEDPDNPGGKHIGMTITSPTFDEIMDNLVSGKIVFARMLSNGGNSYDFYQLSRESQQGIRGKAFDLEFPQGHIWFYDIYIKKRGLGTNTTTYFGVFYDKVVDGGGSGTSEVPDINEVLTKGYTTTKSIEFSEENGNDTNSISNRGLSLSGTATEGLRQVQYSQHGIKAIDNLAGTMTDIFSVDFDSKEVAMSADIKNAFMTALGAQKATEFAEAVGDTSALNTTATDLSGAVNELKSGIDALGEPFRVKQWGSNALNVEIPYCTEDIANANIPKMVFSIDDVEGADYQIVGMIAYEVFDAASGGNRINCFPVCQFTGNGQKELSVRWTCMGTTRKTAKRINAWVLLKHR